MKSQIRLDMTRDGLRIQIVDEQNRPMFDSGSAVVKPYMRELLREIGQVLADVPNRITLEGHTDAQPFIGGERGYSNWELSSDRANASRRELVAGGLPEDRMLRVQGLASSMLFDADEPTQPDEPAHQHHRDEPRCRGPPAPHGARAAEPEARRRRRDGRPRRVDRAAVADPRRADALAMSTDAADLRFLIVDDFSTMRRIVRGLLKEIGYDNADEAGDGAVALQMLRGAHVRLRRHRHRHAQHGRLRAAPAIKADDSLKHLPVLMVTAEARKDDIVRAAQAGAAALHRQAVHARDARGESCARPAPQLRPRHGLSDAGAATGRAPEALAPSATLARGRRPSRPITSAAAPCRRRGSRRWTASRRRSSPGRCRRDSSAHMILPPLAVAVSVPPETVVSVALPPPALICCFSAAASILPATT